MALLLNRPNETTTTFRRLSAFFCLLFLSGTGFSCFAQESELEYGGQVIAIDPDLPQVRKMGKLVSIEGNVDDQRLFRERKNSASAEPGELGTELSDEPNLVLGDFDLPTLSFFTHEPYSNYRSDENDLTYMPGGGDQFGWLSWQNAPYLKKGYKSGLVTGFNMHLLSGPNSVALPPRLYDFSLGYQKRGQFQDVMSYDLATTIGVFSDFEDSARDGVRFPGHAVGMLHYTPDFDFVFGVDYLSRDDIKILPVMGFSWRPLSFEDLRFDIVFPRPRIDYSLTELTKMYLAGRFGGGSWDIEFSNNDNDVVTYRDLQLLLGFESRDANGATSAIEFGYVFDRSLQFRTMNGETHFDDAFLIRMVTRR